MKWKIKPLCEVCRLEPATSFSFVDKRWVFVGNCTSDSERYYIEFKRLFRSPAATVDWLAHMHEKNWMDWDSFMDMLTRFRQATESFGKT